MRAQQQLPATYQKQKTLDLRKNKGLAFWLNLLGLLALVGYGIGFLWLTALLRSDEEGEPITFTITGAEWWPMVLLLIGLIVGAVVLHEFVHALLFRIVTGQWAQWGFKGLYAYAAAPDWYIPRNLHIAIALGPLLLISLVGIGFLLWAPFNWLSGILVVLVINAAGSIGDLITSVWLLRQPRQAYVNDYGDGFTVYTAS
jgi:hypothetical protein